jgi:hypothetical protein
MIASHAQRMVERHERVPTLQELGPDRLADEAGAASD